MFRLTAHYGWEGLSVDPDQRFRIAEQLTCLLSADILDNLPADAICFETSTN